MKRVLSVFMLMSIFSLSLAQNPVQPNVNIGDTFTFSPFQWIAQIQNGNVNYNNTEEPEPLILRVDDFGESEIILLNQEDQEVSESFNCVGNRFILPSWEVMENDTLPFCTDTAEIQNSKVTIEYHASNHSFTHSFLVLDVGEAQRFIYFNDYDDRGVLAYGFKRSTITDISANTSTVTFSEIRLSAATVQSSGFKIHAPVPLWGLIVISLGFRGKIRKSRS